MIIEQSLHGGSYMEPIFRAKARTTGESDAGHHKFGTVWSNRHPNGRVFGKEGKVDADKDESITWMLNELQTALEDIAFDVVDHWESDKCAIGIARPDYHPYVSVGERTAEAIQELASVVRTHFATRNSWQPA